MCSRDVVLMNFFISCSPDGLIVVKFSEPREGDATSVLQASRRLLYPFDVRVLRPFAVDDALGSISTAPILQRLRSTNAQSGRRRRHPNAIDFPVIAQR